MRDRFNEKSPYNQYLPDCSKSHSLYITKKTTSKAILCPMFKDEQGFLSEWVAYYQMHGFDHIMMFDDGSTDGSLEELKPWIDSGFVSIKSNWTMESIGIRPEFTRNEFKKGMTTKALLERQCKLQALEWGYNLTISLDIDEYVIPRKPGVTVVDALDEWTIKTERSAYCMDKLNYQSSPHILEPVNLLTIEAYLLRMRHPRKMSYYTTVASKCAYRLTAPFFTNYTSQFISSCCHFHGCEKHTYFKGESFCGIHHGDENWRVTGKGKSWYDSMDINHYSRSVEKYAMKSKTWKTATGEIKAGQTSEQAARSYDIPNFLARNLGWYHDDTALRYSCQLRELLKNMTKEEVYLRPGFMWYRNPEFGKEIQDPEKRGRYGRHNQPCFKYDDGNLYHYHGKGYTKPLKSLLFCNKTELENW